MYPGHFVRERFCSARDEQPPVIEKSVAAAENIAARRMRVSNREVATVEDPCVIELSPVMLALIVFITAEIDDLTFWPGVEKGRMDGEDLRVLGEDNPACHGVNSCSDVRERV
jgi:hypothetical protein